MNDHELDTFEAELRTLAPARPPADLMARVEAARPGARPALRELELAHDSLFWPAVLRWLAPVGTSAALVLAYGLWHPPGSGDSAHSSSQLAGAVESPAGAKDYVEIDRTLLLAYDAVAELASGEPVRFHCQEWEDRVVFRDPVRGIAIERRTPRLEVIPVGLDTY